MENKIPWERAFEIPKPQVPEPRQPVTQVRRLGPFKNPTRLSWTVNCLLFLCMIAAVAAVWLNYVDIDFLSKQRDGFYESIEAMKADEAAHLTRCMIFLLLSIPVRLSTWIFFFIWVHRANLNARGFGDVRMVYTPGWAVGWYFVPIMNLWKPYYVMKEIYQVSKKPEHWLTQEDVDPIVGLWWLLGIISWVLAGAVRMSMRAKTMDEMIHAGKISIAANAADILSIIACMVLVSVVCRMQLARAGLTSQSESECGIENLTLREA